MHMDTLSTQDLAHYPTPGQKGQQLLIAYADLFSRDVADVGRTDLVKHSIPVDLDTMPI